MKDSIIITRKIQLIPTLVGCKNKDNNTQEERFNLSYKYIRDCRYVQNKAYNILISHIYSAKVSGKSEEEIKMLYKKGKRKPKEDDKEYSLYDYKMKFPEGLPIVSSVGQMVKHDIATAEKGGLYKGKMSLPNRRLDAPLKVESQQFSFFHLEDSDELFYQKLYTSDCKMYMKFVQDMNFEVVLGAPHKSHEIRNVFENIFRGVYEVKGSQITINNKGKIIFLLSIETPKQTRQLDKNTVIGVDLGVARPAVCSLNNNEYTKLYIGSDSNFIKTRTQIQNEYKRLQRSLKNTNGGHGRKKKMKPLDRFKSYEKNFVTTSNHKFSKQIVDFALKNNAGVIQLECLKGYNTNQFILRNWSYYQLQQDIIYKAEKVGIEVRFVNPCYTSQVCSCCGKWHPNNRPKEREGKDAGYFKCKYCGKEMNADFNSSRNISMSTLYLDEQVDEKQKKAARIYYGISEKEYAEKTKEVRKR